MWASYQEWLPFSLLLCVLVPFGRASVCGPTSSSFPVRLVAKTEPRISLFVGHVFIPDKPTNKQELLAISNSRISSVVRPPPATPFFWTSNFMSPANPGGRTRHREIWLLGRWHWNSIIKQLPLLKSKSVFESLCLAKPRMCKLAPKSQPGVLSMIVNSYFENPVQPKVSG